MKKIFTTLLTVVAFSGMLKAQTFGGPDAFGYTWMSNGNPQGPVYSWIELDSMPSAVTVSGLQDDNVVGPITMPINFTYYWYNPATFFIGSNGYIGFTATPVASPFPAIPSPTLIQNYLGGMCSDLTFTGSAGPVVGAACKYWVSPTNDSLVVSWKNVPFWAQGSPGYTGLNSFQIIITSVDSSITYQYLDQTGASAAAAGFCSIGIENNSGIIGLQYLFDVYPTSNTSVKYYYPASVTLAINDAATNYVGSNGSRGLFLTKNSSIYQSEAEVKNVGNQNLASYNVYSRVVNATNGIQVRDTLPSAASTPGQTEVITFPDLFSPTVAGTFRHIVVTQLAGDATASNNQVEREMVVVDSTLLDVTLSYNNGLSSTNGISWSGGGGGIGYYFAPSFTPCYLNQVSVIVDADPNAVGCYIQVYDDDGSNGGPGTLLDSIFIDAASINLGLPTTVNMTQAIPVTSGGFYVAWIMGGDGVLLAEDGLAPYSKQCFEILGNASNPATWSEYRNAEISDPIINAIISTSPLGIDNPVELKNEFGNCSPNPAADYTRIAYSLNESLKNVVCTVTDLRGKLVAKKAFGTVNSGKGSLYIPTQTLKTGVYIVEIANTSVTHRAKLSVVK